MLAASSANAQSDQVRRGPVPSWIQPSELLSLPESTSGPMFVRRQDVQVHLSDSGQAQYSGFRTKILESSGLSIGNVSIAWNPMSGSPIVHGIKVYRDGEVTDVLEVASFEILRREDQLEAAQLDGVLTAVLRVADLRVGDELEVDITTFTNDPTLGGNEAGLIVLGPSPLPGRYHLRLGWDNGQKPNFKMTADFAKIAVVSERAVDVRVDNPATVSPPKDAPVRYRWQRVLEFADFADWSDVSAHFAPLYKTAATLPDDSIVKREAARIGAAHADPLARASAALKLVQQDVRYIYVGLNGGNLTPATADQTWQRRYGDCKGKTTLLLALLAELGVDAEPVLVNSTGTDDGLDQRLPVPQYFDHVLVRARIGGTTYWLDGTLPPVASPSARPIFPVRWILPLTSGGSKIEQLDWQPAITPDEINLMEIDARAGFDIPARIVATSILRGAQGLQQQQQFSSVSAEQLREVIRQRGVGEVWQTIDDVQWRYDQKAGASILTISGTGTVDWEDKGNGAKSLALPGGGFNPPERRVRPSDQNQDAPFYSKPGYTCQVTTVRLPSSTEAKQWSSKASFDAELFGKNYYRAWELRDGAIRMVRGSRIVQPEIDAASADRDNARIATFDNSMGWIFYRPSSLRAAVGSGEQVPATYDFNWTAEDVPCVAPVKRRSVGSAAGFQSLVLAPENH